jgi:hypothetical protein
MSMPTSAIAWTADRVDVVGRLGTGGADLDGVPGEVAQPNGGHLRAARASRTVRSMPEVAVRNWSSSTCFDVSLRISVLSRSFWT